MIETERLTIRPFTNDDAEFVLRLLNDPDFIRHIADRGVRTLSQSCDYLAAGPLASYAKHGFGLWRVARKDDDVPIGMCGLLKRDALEHVDVGYAFLPEHRGRGFAREAVVATLAHARDVVRLARVVAIVSPGNAPSIRLLESLGFGFERMVRIAPDGEELKLFGVDLASA